MSNVRPVNLLAKERSDQILLAELLDPKGALVAGTDVSSVRVTLTDPKALDPDAPVNGRSNQQVLVGAAGTTGEMAITAEGEIQFSMKEADFILTGRKPAGLRHMILAVIYTDFDAATRTVRLPFDITIRNVRGIT